MRACVLARRRARPRVPLVETVEVPVCDIPLMLSLAKKASEDGGVGGDAGGATGRAGGKKGARGGTLAGLGRDGKGRAIPPPFRQVGTPGDSWLVHCAFVSLSVDCRGR